MRLFLQGIAAANARRKQPRQAKFAQLTRHAMAIPAGYQAQTVFGSNQTPSGPGHQRGSPSRGASTARISPDAAVFGARLQRRYLEEKAASGAAASSAAANGVASGVLRLCWRRAAGRGDGAKCRRASDRSAGPLSDRTTLSLRAPGVSYGSLQRPAERADLAAQRPGIVVSGTRGRRRSGGRGSNLRRGGKRREIRPFDDDADGDLLAF